MPKGAPRGRCGSSRPLRPAVHTVCPGRHVEDFEAESVSVGDDILVRPGELLPCDGVVLDGRSHVDAARLTGEPVPVSAAVRACAC